MDASKLYGACAFAAGLAITLVLAAYLTPRDWWRRPNLRALLILVAGTWGLGSALLWLAPRSADSNLLASAAPPAPSPVPAPSAAPTASAEWAPVAGQPFQVHRDLNLRSGPGVNAPRLLVVPAGASVTPTGARDGDWWQIRTHVAEHDRTGWSSSLWLRRAGE